MAESNADGFGEIGQIAINIKDLDRAVEFYRDKLGLSFLYQFPGLAFFGCGGVRLMLSRPEGEGAGDGSSILYFRVKDIEAKTRALKEKGVNFKDDPRIIAEMDDYTLWMAFFEDSERNIMALMSEIPKGQ